ncbi:MAG: PAS domain-containing protein [Tenacibaculum sp.]
MKTSLNLNKIAEKQVEWDKTQTIVSKTDLYGTILYANEVFIQVSEYSAIELVGEPHSIIRHPDMPKVTFKLLWEALKRGENFHAIIKNLTKTGCYYWVITDFTIDKDKSGKPCAYTARRKAVPDGVVKKIEPVYQTLLEIEKIKGEKISELYFDAYLKEEIGKTYNNYVVELFEQECQKEQMIKKNAKSSLKKGLNWFFFGEYE